MGFHHKPIGLLNVGGYYAAMEALLENAWREGFLKKSRFDIVVRAEEVSKLLDRLEDEASRQ